MTDDEIVWNKLMNDDNIDELSLRFRGDRMQLRWRYPNGPNHYRWFPAKYP